MKVAFVHDWLNGMRGGEIVLETMLKEFPDAPVYTLFHDKGSVSEEIERHPIFTSFLQNFPLRKRFYRFMLPLFPYAIESFHIRGYDLIISSSHCVAKGVIPDPNSFHISFVFSPMRYIWDLFEDYFGDSGRIKKSIINFFAKSLREWDFSSSSRVDLFVAISGYVAERIKKFYGRESIIIHPPVLTDKFEVQKNSGDFYLIVSAMAPYKRIDLAIEAFSIMKKRLLIAGSGQEEKKIRRLCADKKNINYLGWVGFEKLKSLLQECRAFILPGIEDFGIAPVEAMACGKPVIAYGKGGVLDSVIPLGSKGEKPTGLFFEEQTPDSLIKAVETFEKNINEFDPVAIRKHSEKFSDKVFLEKFRGLIEGVKRGVIKRR
jgi:glycosyltransferase involved in cell wall biosynthesis